MLSLTPGRPLLMGIVNVTPDSFSDGGLYLSPDHAVEQALRLIDEGADLIDLGAESTRPPGATYGAGARAVTAEEELARLLPVLAGLRRQSAVPVSIDTRKASVARALLDAGADLLNDVSALEDPDTAALAASSGCAVVLMHHHGIFAAAPRSRAERVVFEVRSGLDALVQRAVAAGCQRDQLVLDPGLGFGKVGGQNLELLRRLPELRTLDRPLLVGASRKSFLGGLAGPLEPPAERLEPSLAAAAWAAAGGAAVLRVHDVGATRKFLAAWTAIDSAGTGGPA
ncbi:MAG: dihydropteroate synthase [Thermoanaerobaculia bacterium]|nr:dihydropteroate synthase [Thermoanaerobaculia bacterium]